MFTPTCSIPGCHARAGASGFCEPHRQDYATIEDHERILAEAHALVTPDGLTAVYRSTPDPDRGVMWGGTVIPWWVTVARQGLAGLESRVKIGIRVLPDAEAHARWAAADEIEELRVGFLGRFKVGAERPFQVPSPAALTVQSCQEDPCLTTSVDAL